jgi:hypothetical protein
MLVVVSILVGLIVITTAAVYVGALLAIIRPDHRNPLARPMMDWVERHTKERGAANQAGPKGARGD